MRKHSEPYREDQAALFFEAIMKWFKHSGTASRDAKVAKLLAEFGIEGYGLYFYCIELIASKTDSDDLTFELEHDAALIAEWVKLDTLKVEKIMQRCIELELFGIADNGHLTCFKLIKWIDRKLVGETTYARMVGQIGDYPRKPPIIPAKVGENPLSLEENRTDKKRKEEDAKAREDSPSQQLTPGDRIEKAREAWNAADVGPENRFGLMNLRSEDQRELLRILGVFSDDEISRALENYAAIRADPEADILPYQSFVAFMAKGVEKFLTLDPGDVKRKAKQPEDNRNAHIPNEAATLAFVERQERERAEAKAETPVDIPKPWEHKQVVAAES
jgi:hypothetical protein